MRPLMLVCALTFAACGDDTTSAPAADLAAPQDLASCANAPSCPACATGTSCYS